MADMLATTADLAALLQRDPTAMNQASAILALEVTTAVVQAAADGQRIVLAGPTTETVWGGTGKVLRLSQWPVVSVASVTFNGTLLSTGTASGTWRKAANGLWRNVGWTDCSWEPSQVDVVYTHGIPDDDQRIQLGRGAALSLARGLFVNPDGTVSEKIDDYAVAFEKASEALDASPALKSLIRKQYGPKARMVAIG